MSEINPIKFRINDDYFYSLPYFSKHEFFSDKSIPYFCLTDIGDFVIDKNGITLYKEGYFNYRLVEILTNDTAKMYVDYIEKLSYNTIMNYVFKNFTRVLKSSLIHLSPNILDDLKFIPRIPKNFLTEQGYEDNITKRISFSSDIDSALKGLSMNLENKKLYVYTAPYNTDFIVPSRQQVPDVEITNEKWVLNPVTVRLIGQIQIIDVLNEIPDTYVYGDNYCAEVYGWDWKWV